MKPRLSLGVLAGTLLLSGSSLAETTIFEEIICRVNNDIITKSEYEGAIKPAQGPGPGSAKTLRRRVGAGGAREGKGSAQEHD